MKTQMTHRSTSHIRGALLSALCLATTFTAQAASPPVITGVTAGQQAGTKLVNIAYTISDPDSASINASIFVSKDSGASWTVPAITFDNGTGKPGNNIAVTATPTAKTVVWDAGADWNGHFTSKCRVRVLASDNGLVGVPAGSFVMGDATDGDPFGFAPLTTVTVGAFQMDSKLVTGSQWNLVTGYAESNGLGYVFDNVGSYKALDHPVQTINWFDAVKWCNARSQMEGRTPVYYTDEGFATVYKTGQGAPAVNRAANGYRLPTEAEWEKAARGGLSGKRFPWGDTITHSQANYVSSASYPYDTSLTRGYHPTYNVGSQPFTSPVGSFEPPNGYGLYDMAGNVFEWCWDRFGTYAGGSDPQGPPTGSNRILRGGSWNYEATSPPCASRQFSTPTTAYHGFGFRVVLPPGQP